MDSRFIRLRGFSLLAVLATVLVVACSSTPQLAAEWSDPSLGANSALLRGSRVLIACEAFDIAVRQVCQQQFAAEVLAHGATPVLVAPETQLLGDRPIDGQLIPAARGEGTRTMLVVTLTPATSDVSQGFSLGIGGVGYGHSSAAGVGVTAPIGGGHAETGFSANGRITDVSTGKLVWTATAVAPPSSDLAVQFAALAKAVLNSASRAGLF